MVIAACCTMPTLESTGSSPCVDTFSSKGCVVVAHACCEQPSSSCTCRGSLLHLHGSVPPDNARLIQKGSQQWLAVTVHVKTNILYEFNILYEVNILYEFVV